MHQQDSLRILLGEFEEYNVIYEVLNLRDKPVNGFMPTITIYSTYDSMYKCGYLDKPRKTPAVVICPGGGYNSCSPREAEPIAMQFCAAGMKAFVVDYCTKPIRYPEPLIDLSNAVKLIRKNADAWNVDPDKILVAGFSAGGHLAACLGTLWNTDPYIKAEDASNKPNAMILGYPVIEWRKNGHIGSFYNFLGEGLPEREYEKFSLEKRVTKDTPPTFLWHTFSDSIVPVENSMDFAYALRENGIPFELHIFPEGDHGMSCANEETSMRLVPHISSWINAAREWVNIVFGKE